MFQKLLSMLSFVLFLSCAKKESTELLNSGNYDDAIQIAIQKLRTDKNAKSKQTFIYITEEAFAKAKERDERNIKLWLKDPNANNIEKIYDTYVILSKRQELIRPLLPLKLLKENRNANFPMEDYSDEIINSRNTLVSALYQQANQLLKSNQKTDARKAFDDLTYIQQLQPNHKNAVNLMQDAKFKGTDFVLVSTRNETNMVIPVRLEKDLLDFNQYGLQKKWMEFHNKKQNGHPYDYELVINFRDILISPEQIREKEIIQEKQIKDGVKNLLDSNGKVVKDSLGNPIKVDNFKTIRATVYQFQQFKACKVTAKVDYYDLNSKQLFNSFPLESEFVFDHFYATMRGDRRACDEIYLTHLGNKALPFPSNEQMVFDSGEHLKNQLKLILQRNQISR